MKKDTKTTAKEVITKAETAVKATAAKAETAAKATAAKAETAAKATAAKAETAAKKAETAAKKAAAKKPAAKKPAAKKAPAVNAVLQFAGKEISVAEMAEKAKSAWTGSEIKEMNLYIKPEDNRVYVVVNGDEAGSIEL